VTGSGSTRHIDYLLTDRLGSVDAVANANGVLTETRGYDAFGKPRTGSWADAAPPRLGTTANTPHGFTGHEHLDGVELIHMNGRVYDYNIGRFTGVDPVIQAPLNSQSFNPYSYILNNPLSGTDPTGYEGNCSDGSSGNCASVQAEQANLQAPPTGSHISNGSTSAGPGYNIQVADHSMSSGSNGAKQGASPTPESRQTSQGAAQSGAPSTRPNDGNANGAASGGIGGVHEQYSETHTVGNSSDTQGKSEDPPPYAARMAQLQVKYPAITSDILKAAFQFLSTVNPKSAYAESGKALTEYSTALDKNGGKVEMTGVRQGSAGHSPFSIGPNTVGLPHTHGSGGDWTYQFFSRDDVNAASAAGRSIPVLLSNEAGDFRVFYPGMRVGGVPAGSITRLPMGGAEGFTLCSACVPTRPQR
ncbi:MAG: RHS repeat-associated core domain-containing protein, partial [Acidobacteriales bacterium]|nr:RHS repeat-associated core domain-containing protein [Terriglobales bacterium]